MTSQQVFLFSIIVALFLICVNEIQTVRILVNYAVLVESVKHGNLAVSSEFCRPNPGWHKVNLFYPTLLVKSLFKGRVWFIYFICFPEYLDQDSPAPKYNRNFRHIYTKYFPTRLFNSLYFSASSGLTNHLFGGESYTSTTTVILIIAASFVLDTGAIPIKIILQVIF